MLKIVIPISSIMAIIFLFGMLSFFGDVHREAQEGDMDGIEWE